jgi:hypothetical protein
MDNKSEPELFIATTAAGHPGAIYSSNQAGVPEAFARITREGGNANAGQAGHRIIMGKTRDGMSGFRDGLPNRIRTTRATGLLASLLRRI